MEPPNPMRMELQPRRVRQSPREVKVKLSHPTCIRLHAQKILRGQGISATVETALKEYFERLAGQPGALTPEQMVAAGLTSALAGGDERIAFDA
ncbi:MAG TPA: hypothetical protein VM681_10985 [Candidatus Thermoplasmatota archaeon]|nr:hypothetical protein [Candidatus Thermoplasmatota archaeon]